MSAEPTTCRVAETGEGRYTQTITASRHTFAADEPVEIGGLDKGPAPYDFLLSALGACTSMTLRMYADRKGWEIGRITVELTHRKEEGSGGVKRDIITRDISFSIPLDDEKRARLKDIADKCPIHRTLEAVPVITTAIKN